MHCSPRCCVMPNNGCEGEGGCSARPPCLPWGTTSAPAQATRSATFAAGRVGASAPAPRCRVRAASAFSLAREGIQGGASLWYIVSHYLLSAPRPWRAAPAHSPYGGAPSILGPATRSGAWPVAQGGPQHGCGTRAPSMFLLCCARDRARLLLFLFLLSAPCGRRRPLSCVSPSWQSRRRASPSFLVTFFPPHLCGTLRPRR
ncbi:hypothetical protein SAMN05428974_0597 [Sphingopyxis sp. YR583]|nr:hypothetical protein SAMN05428974_0597 [Sphingopyxis sp. YR583]